MDITYIGNFSGSGAYPTINRHLTAALERQGATIHRNIHNIDSQLTPIALSCVYPPAPPNIRHAFQACISNWEFGGVDGVPTSFVDVFRQFDLVIAKSAWTAEQFRSAVKGTVPVVSMPLGVDMDEFSPQGDVYALPPEIADKITLLYVGGTDKRHGLDIALKIIDALPEHVHLVAKLSTDYPDASLKHERITFIRENLPGLAPLYRACDVFLQPARGVGTSLPTMEAIACGMTVISSKLPPIQEYATIQMREIDGEWQAMSEAHHIHKDCSPVWFEPDIEAFIRTIKQLPTLAGRPPRYADLRWRKRWTWDNAAKQLLKILHEYRVTLPVS